MRLTLSIAPLVCLLAVASACYAETLPASGSSAETSSSAAPAPPVDATPLFFAAPPPPPTPEMSSRPFSAVAIAAKVGLEGIGFDVATPMTRHFNLRAGASFVSYNSASYLIDGMTANGGLSFKTVGASLDYFPFGGGFHLSPGLVFYNGNKINTNITVTTTDKFSLNNVSYTATTTITGTLNATLGNQVAPSFTIGFGNLLPRKGGHWSVPVELGFEYIGSPKVALNLAGTVCPSSSPCTPLTASSIDTGSAYTNLQNEQTDLQNDISGLKIFPVFSIGVGYKF